jgi:hypothetical protein
VFVMVHSWVWCSMYLKFYFSLRHNLATRQNLTVFKHLL